MSTTYMIDGLEMYILLRLFRRNTTKVVESNGERCTALLWWSPFFNVAKCEILPTKILHRTLNRTIEEMSDTIRDKKDLLIQPRITNDHGFTIRHEFRPISRIKYTECTRGKRKCTA